ncbi:MAG: alpha/beta hydrolase [Proteobacteria bacterium]|uniref:Alpha/beta hydrolase n=1 Tax=Candidatus Avisuccinivibrio stercorigallinarum TaxID=2840704 RepID=A0A9D9GTL2_9GAMM|nr:alpha/beta hydrolase [Candidatus Avisuccinivibrio stercorigallinarum]
MYKLPALSLITAALISTSALAEEAFNPMANPSTPEQWEAFTTISYKGSMQSTAAIQAQYNLKIESLNIAGVPCYLFTPQEVKHDGLLFFVHGGGYVLGAGLAGAPEGLYMAALTGYQVLAVDYRMPPAEEPFPAAIDDMMAVYAEVVKEHDPQSIGVFGSSTGGALTLLLSQDAQRRNLPQPAALISGTPWSDISRTGDTYESNDHQDTVLVSYDGWIKPAALLYANGVDLKDPRLSPVYGEFDFFPPTLLVSGTRDLFLSNTVRVQQKLLKAGREVDLLVLEGVSHCGYYLFGENDTSKFYHQQAEKFWTEHLKADSSAETEAAQ